MNENLRTVVFLIVALVIAGATFAVPALMKTDKDLASGESIEDLKGTLLFPEFKDPLSATSLEVIRYNEETGDRSQFEVAQVNGIWSIPSHENYPADAEDQLAAAAASLIDLKVLGVASDSRADHGLYGVIDPTDKDLAAGTPGVGMKVIMKGKKDKKLVSMIVGKTDKDKPELRYVRRTGQDVVLTVKLSTDKLTTDFGDWIEKDLLKLNAWDLNKIYVEDYSIDEMQGHVLLSDEFTLGFESSGDPKWKLLANRVFNKENQWEDIQLGPNQELNTKRLDEMQTALDDLKIVDVARKPAAFSEALATDKTSFTDPEAGTSLMQHGFYPAKVQGKAGIYSNEGEIRVLMKDGVEYVLRFGGIAGSDGSLKTGEGEQADSDGVNRYLFITAQFNSKALPKPDIKPLPNTLPGEKKETKPEKAKEDKKDEASDKSKEGDKTAKKDEPKPGEAKSADLEKLRAEINKENQRAQDSYDEKVAEAKEKVTKLNARFADWYYVISESVYKKIHLGRDEIIKEKASANPKSEAGSNLPISTEGVPPDVFQPVQPGTEKP